MCGLEGGGTCVYMSMFKAMNVSMSYVSYMFYALLLTGDARDNFPVRKGLKKRFTFSSIT